MSQNPPPPPEQPLPPKSDQNEEFVEIIMSRPASTASTTPSAASAAAVEDAAIALKSCLWLFTGMFGCILVSMLVIGVGLFSVGREAFVCVTAINNCLNIEPPFIRWGEPDPVNIPSGIVLPDVEPIQALAELVTTRYNYAQIVTGQTDMPPVLNTLYGDGLAMVAVGHIEAGIDVSQITPDDIRYDEDGGQLTITLPSPQLRACFLNEAESYVVTRQTGLLAPRNLDLEDSTRQYAIDIFRDEALEQGILSEAQTEAETVITEFVQTLVQNETVTIIIEFDEPTALVFPETCG